MSSVCIALAGLPGSGKTSFAVAWCRLSGAHLLSRDLIKRAVFGSTLDVGTEQNEVAFATVKAALPIILRAGQSVVIDGCTFAREGLMEDIEAICAQSHARCIPVLVDCPQSVAAQRLATPDPNGPRDRTVALVARVAATFRLRPPHWRVLDGTQEVTENIARMKAFLSGSSDNTVSCI